MLSEYFQSETKKLQDQCLSDIKTLDDWKAKRPVYKQQLLEMLGLDPLPAKTPLQATTTGTTEQEQFTVEKLHYQSMPGLVRHGGLVSPQGPHQAGAGGPLRLRPRQRQEGRDQLRLPKSPISIMVSGLPGTVTSA